MGLNFKGNSFKFFAVFASFAMATSIYFFSKKRDQLAVQPEHSETKVIKADVKPIEPEVKEPELRQPNLAEAEVKQPKEKEPEVTQAEIVQPTAPVVPEPNAPAEPEKKSAEPKQIEITESSLQPNVESVEKKEKVKLAEQPEAVPDEKPVPVVNSEIQKNESEIPVTWNYEFGIGGDYINMATSSSLTNVQTSGFSGPTEYFAAERVHSDYSFKISLLDINSKMNSQAGGQSFSQTINWRSLWLGGTTPGAWVFPRLEYGLEYKEAPLFYQDLTGNGTFQNGKAVFASVGFTSTFHFLNTDTLTWNQRVLLPLWATATGGEVQTFSPLFGIEGTVSYFSCLQNGLAIGASWLGEYEKSNFSLPGSVNAAAENSSASMLNSNFQIRVQYGTCGDRTKK